MYQNLVGRDCAVLKGHCNCEAYYDCKYYRTDFKGNEENKKQVRRERKETDKEE